MIHYIYPADARKRDTLYIIHGGLGGGGDLGGYSDGDGSSHPSDNDVMRVISLVYINIFDLYICTYIIYKSQ